jgi:hypothetical protein
MHGWRAITLLLLSAGLGHLACAVGEVGAGFAALGGPTGCDGRYLADIDTSFDAQVDLTTPGAAPAFLFDAAIPGSTGAILQTYRLVITLPAEFGFLGFDVLGAGAQIGQVDFDFGGDGSYQDPADYTIPHRAIDANTAYADSLLNGSYDVGVDAIGAHTLDGQQRHVFTLTLPSGGTNFGGVCSYFDTSTRFRLPAGIIQLPATPGSYDATIVATSVDPDTGDTDDGAGIAPTVYQRTVPIQVPEPHAALLGAAACAALAATARRRLESRPTAD